MEEESIHLTGEESKLRQLLLDVADYIQIQGRYERPQLRFTGGWVRDKRLGLSSKDIDISVSNMTGFSFATLMKAFLDDPRRKDQYGQDALGHLAKIEANPEKSKHLETVTTKILGLEIDLVNLRKEIYSENSRNPTMEFGTAEEDAFRRDATVNALFYNLDSGKVEDFTKRGKEDMKRKIIRTPLPPYRTFKDDPLRVLRCIRFASKLDYNIDPEVEQCMGDLSIKEALRAKISRERIGIEVVKMLKGPRPQKALSLIDRLGLYDTIFTDPKQDIKSSIVNEDWFRAYDLLSRILNEPEHAHLRTIRSILIPTSGDVYLSWLLCAIAPWVLCVQETEIVGSLPTTTKTPPLIAVTVAREGLKIENKSINVIKNGVMHYDDITCSINSSSDSVAAPSVSGKRKYAPSDREELGMQIRGWGVHWRSSTVLSLLVNSMKTGTGTGHEKLLARYSSWLSRLEQLEILETHAMRPLIDGDCIAKAVGRDRGPWMKEAIEVVIRWQLRNPGKADSLSALAEVISRFKLMHPK